MFILALLLVWPVGHIDSDVIDWVTKTSQVPTEFELTECQFEFELETASISSQQFIILIWNSIQEKK